MAQDRVSGLTRRTFLRSLGAGMAATSLGPLSLQRLAAGQEQPFVIGMANPLATFFGEAAEKALSLAINQINDDGGILGRPLELVVSDTAGRADQAPLALQDLVSRGADVLTGFFFSESLIGALPTFPSLSKLVLSTGPGSPAPSIQVANDYESFKYFFRVGPINSFFILQNTVLFVRDFLEKGLGWDSIVVFAEDAAWTQPITSGFTQLLKSFGSEVEVVETIRYPESTTDFTPFFDRAANAMEGRTGGLVTVMAHTGTRPTSQWASQEVPLPMAGVNVQAQDGRFDELTEGASDSVITFTSGARAPITDRTVPFVDDFADFSAVKPEVTIPSYNAFVSYDALFLLKEAAEAIGTLPTDEASTNEIIQELETYGALNDAGEPTKLFTGTTGEIGFYQRGETGVTPLEPEQAFPHDVRFIPGKLTGVWIQWQEGRQEVLFPPDLATGEFEAPPWMG